MGGGIRCLLRTTTNSDDNGLGFMRGIRPETPFENSPPQSVYQASSSLPPTLPSSHLLMYGPSNQ